MFSIIIPLYNKAPYIEKTILSVAAQTFQEFELIIIDDGSNDDGLLVANKLLSSLPPPFGGWGAVSQENQGVSSARNNGVKLAKYNYIAFLDADDWWAPTYLEEMKGLIEQFPEAGIYGSSYYIVKNRRQRIAPIGVTQGFEKGIIDYCNVYANTLCMPLWTGATIIRKTIFEKENGFKPNLKLGEDFDLWVRVAIKHPVAFLNKSLAYYNQDVDINNRAVGARLYKPQENMLFTRYDLSLTENPDFDFLFQRLALYGLLNYYQAGVLKDETKEILSKIDWRRHEKKYFLYYKILSPSMLNLWFGILNKAYLLKQSFKKKK